MVKRSFSIIFLLFVTFSLVSGEAVLKIADASRTGIRALNAAALRSALTEKTSVAIDRVTPRAALQRLRSGKADLIVLEQGELPAEKPAFCQLFAAEACAVYVHRENPFSNVTDKKLAEILQARRPAWNRLAPGKDTDIHRYALNGKAVGYRLPESLLNLTHAAKEIFKTGSTEEMLLLIQNNPEALGVGLWLPGARQIKVLSVNGIRPSFENISSGKYPLSIRYYLLARKDLSQAGRRFVGFLKTPEFIKDLEEFGFISL